jgi:hypothetical protein
LTKNTHAVKNPNRRFAPPLPRACLSKEIKLNANKFRRVLLVSGRNNFTLPIFGLLVYDLAETFIGEHLKCIDFSIEPEI